jgi:3-oxoacyl-(acyl-carrier-protein) synthase
MGKPRRVAITGLGIVSALGTTVAETWRRVLAGESGARQVQAFDARTWPVTFAHEVTDFAVDDEAILPAARRYLNRPSSFGVQAALEAMRDSGIEGQVAPERFGVSVGASIGAISPVGLARMLGGNSHPTGLRSIGDGRPNDPALAPSETNALLRNHPGTLAALLSSRWHALGPVSTIHTACASSGQSLGQAFLQIRRGEADAVLAGGADSLAGELLLAGFCLLGALSTRNDAPEAASRPFDKDRDGFVAGEGAAMLVLEEMEAARARGARIYGELAGYGETASAYRVTDMPEDGRGISEAMEYAVREAGLSFTDVQYVNAHGTAPQLNDRVEAVAVRKVFGARGGRPMINSTKSEVGHLISAAGAMEAAFCALSLVHGKVPPTRNLVKTDCGDDLDFVAGAMRTAEVHAAVSNSIGFGGTNTSLLLKGGT